MTDIEHRMIVTKETWNKLTAENRDWILYESLAKIEERITKIESLPNACTAFPRLDRIEKKSLFHKSIAFMGGVVGGIIAFFTTKIVGQ